MLTIIEMNIYIKGEFAMYSTQKKFLFIWLLIVSAFLQGYENELYQVKATTGLPPNVVILFDQSQDMTSEEFYGDYHLLEEGDNHSISGDVWKNYGPYDLDGLSNSTGLKYNAIIIELEPIKYEDTSNGSTYNNQLCINKFGSKDYSGSIGQQHYCLYCKSPTCNTIGTEVYKHAFESYNDTDSVYARIKGKANVRSYYNIKVYAAVSSYRYVYLRDALAGPGKLIDQLANDEDLGNRIRLAYGGYPLYDGTDTGDRSYLNKRMHTLKPMENHAPCSRSSSDSSYYYPEDTGKTCVEYCNQDALHENCYNMCHVGAGGPLGTPEVEGSAECFRTYLLEHLLYGHSGSQQITHKQSLDRLEDAFQDVYDYYSKGSAYQFPSERPQVDPFIEHCRPNVCFLITGGGREKDYSGNFSSVMNRIKSKAEKLNSYSAKNDICKGDCATDCPNGDCPGDRIEVYPISFANDVPQLQEIADVGQGKAAGKGDFFAAKSGDELINHIKETIHSVMRAVASSSLSAPAPTLAEAGSEYGNNVYLPAYATRSGGHWWGTINKMCRFGSDCLLLGEFDDDGIYKSNEDNINEIYSGLSFYKYAYNVDNETPYDHSDDGYKIGVNPILKTLVESRKIYYPDSGDSDRFLTLSAKPAGWSDEAYNFLTGKFSDGSGARHNPMGDIWHSAIVFIDKDDDLGTEEDVFLIAGSNEGFLHVFKESDGKEQKAVIPNEAIYEKHKNLDYRDKADKNDLYGIDTTPVRIKSGSIDWIAVSFRRGGAGYAFIKTNDLLETLGDGSRDKVISDKNGKSFGQSWSPPILHKRGGEDYIVMPYGYDAFFDNDSSVPTNYGGADFHIYSTGIDDGNANLNNMTYSKSYYPSSGRVYPVVGSIFPFEYDNIAFLDYDTTVGVKKNKDSVASGSYIYYSDILGNLFYIDGSTDTIGKVIDYESISGQDFTVVANEKVNKVYGSAKPVTIDADSSRNGGFDKEVWVFYGTGDRTRITRKD